MSAISIRAVTETAKKTDDRATNPNPANEKIASWGERRQRLPAGILESIGKWYVWIIHTFSPREQTSIVRRSAPDDQIAGAENG
jgi:hypothetical protein